MTQKEMKQLIKLLDKWADFVRSGRHELPDALTPADAAVQGEPMYAEIAYLIARQVKRWEV